VRPESIKQIISAITTLGGIADDQAKCMLVFAHPDDEVIAAGARLRAFRNAHFIYVTDGAPRDERDSRSKGFRTLDAYRQARFHELNRAFRLAGIQSSQQQCLGYSDQESAYKLPELTETIANLIRAHRVQVVLTHPYEGGHPDHDAAAFAVHAAARLLEEPLLIVEAPFYHQGPHGIETGKFLRSSETEEVVYTLSDAERAHKRALLDCFTTQRETLRYFSTQMERYRSSPQYVFTEPPHPGSVFYDRFSWGITSDQFCRMASESEKQLTFVRPVRCSQ
jgi:N-acetylglucosamine malate deacetylase 2